MSGFKWRAELNFHSSTFDSRIHQRGKVSAMMENSANTNPEKWRNRVWNSWSITKFQLWLVFKNILYRGFEKGCSKVSHLSQFLICESGLAKHNSHPLDFLFQIKPNGHFDWFASCGRENTRELIFPVRTYRRNIFTGKSSRFRPVISIWNFNLVGLQKS